MGNTATTNETRNETMTTNDTQIRLLCPANKIDAACFVQGDDDEFVVDFYDIGGSIVRTSYNRRSTVTVTTFVPVDCWEYDELKRMSLAA
jgi:hypothetical protein